MMLQGTFAFHTRRASISWRTMALRGFCHWQVSLWRVGPKIATPETTYDYVYDCGNKVQSIQTNHGESITLAYDGELMTSMTQSGTLNQSIGHSYNSDFLPVGIAYAGGTETLDYDRDGLLIRTGDAVITRNAQTGFAETISDDTYVQTNTHNGYGETQSENTSVDSEDVYRYEITDRLPNGQIHKKSETIGGETHEYRYNYDNRGRLTQVAKDKKVVEQYHYDANGNRVRAVYTAYTEVANKKGKTHTEKTRTTVQSSYTISDQLETVGDATYAYDEDGYLTSKITGEGTTHYSYGTLGELRSVVKPDGTVIEYVHNANNQRVAKMVNGTVTEKYLWANLTTLLAVYDGSDNLLERFEYADGRMPYKMTRNGQTYYLSYDQVGTLKAVSAEDGTIVKSIEYDTFGNVLSDSNDTFKMPFGFAGGLYDPDTKLTRFGYRDYDAETGKWTAKDPIGFDGGDTNLYGYVLGDPVNLVDSEGLFVGWIGPAIFVIGGYAIWMYFHAVPAVNQASAAISQQKQCSVAIQNGQPFNCPACTQANTLLINGLQNLPSTAVNAAGLAGTYSGGPIPTTSKSAIVAGTSGMITSP